MRIPEEAARYYELHFNAGRTLITVDAGDREMEATGILKRHGAYDAQSRSGDTDFLRAEALSTQDNTSVGRSAGL
jgi:hypothetical protein